MDYRKLLLAGAVSTMLVPNIFAKNVKSKPNIIFILADDLGYGDLSCYGQEKFTTPNIDALARQGLRFTQFYSGTTVSAPSRASLLTGKHSGHTVIRGNKEVQPEGQMSLPEGIENMFTVMKRAGYTTGAFGKWGLGAPGAEGDPNNQGVDEFFGYNCQFLAHNYYPDHLWENQNRVELRDNDNGKFGTYSQDLIQEKGLQFIDNNKDKPFFLFLPYTLPHAELIVPQDSIINKFRGKFPEKPYKGTDSGPYFRKGGYASQPEPHATFAAMVYRLDVYVGQIMSKLRELGLEDNTIVLFASDNGPHREGGADPEFFNSNGIYRGAKRDLYEGGVRVPFIVSWKNKVREGQTDMICTFWDLMPTFAEIGKYKIRNNDGISILPTLTGKGKQKQHSYLYFEFHEGGGKQAVRKGDWKLVRLNANSESKSVYELYNLASDPQEIHNLLNSRQDKYKELKDIMLQAHSYDSNWPLLESEFSK